ncbi:MAG: hypothetical protein ACLU4W_11525, partial [Acutalibacteraceae bacterium]
YSESNEHTAERLDRQRIYALAIKAFSSVLVAFGIGAAPFSAYAGWILLGFIALGLLTGMVGCAISMKRYLKNGGGSLG